MNSSLHSNTFCLASLSWMLYRLCSGNISSGRSSTAGVVLFSDLSAAAGLGWMSVLSSFLPQSYYHSDLIHSTVTDHRWFIHPDATYWCCNVIYPLMVCTITESAHFLSQEEQAAYKMSGIIVFLGTDTAWILEAIHLRDIPISQRFALWYPASWLVKGFTIRWVCASLERVIFQWHLKCFFWLGGNGSNPRCREVERDIAAQGRAPREMLALYPPSPSFFLWDIQNKHTNPL